MEKIFQVILLIQEILKMPHIFRIRIVSAFDLDPLTCDVIGDSLYARPDHAVLGNLLQGAVPDKRGDRVLPHVSGVLL